MIIYIIWTNCLVYKKIYIYIYIYIDIDIDYLDSFSSSLVFRFQID